jgi:hypothetical protein
MKSSKATACLLLLLAAGCARNAPSLPPDLSHLPADQRLLAGDADSPEARMDCAALKQEAALNKAQIQQYEGVILANRGHNQAVGYAAGVLFPPLLLASKNDDDAKKNLDERQAKADRIDRLSKAKGCS